MRLVAEPIGMIRVFDFNYSDIQTPELDDLLWFPVRNFEDNIYVTLNPNIYGLHP